MCTPGTGRVMEATAPCVSIRGAGPQASSPCLSNSMSSLRSPASARSSCILNGAHTDSTFQSQFNSTSSGRLAGPPILSSHARTQAPDAAPLLHTLLTWEYFSYDHLTFLFLVDTELQEDRNHVCFLFFQNYCPQCLAQKQCSGVCA